MAHFNHFDFLSPYYDRFIKYNDPTKFRVLAELPTRGLLLDAGGGTGRKSYPLLGMVDGIIIADSSMGMLSQANKKVGLFTTCCETEQLPFADESFERVIMVDALHHVGDHHATIKELWRLVKPGGRIVIEEPDIRSGSVKIMAFIEKLAFMRSHFISPLKIAEAFHFPHSRVNLEFEAPNAWVVVSKLVV
jgi:ubiquinone/menaquinone biosynthesis C-methylase UbiE